MPLTPDDIAKRSFTPSVDGYHQGEVREFLTRVAAEHRSILASMPDNQRQVSELTVAIASHEQRLHLLERRLQATLDQLDTTAAALQKTQDRASQQLAAARKITADQQSLIEQLSTQAAPTSGTAAGTGAGVGGSARTGTHRAAASAVAPTMPATATPTTPTTPPQTQSLRENEASASAPRPSAPAAQPTPTTTPPIPAPAAQPTPAPTTPRPTSAAPAVGFLDDLDKEPLISDNAHDLLDNVLGDIMGDITEGPDA